MKSLRSLADYFLYLCQSQLELEARQLEFSKTCLNPNQLFRSLNQSRTPNLTSQDITDFMASFTYDLVQSRVQGSNYKVITASNPREVLLKQGVDLLIKHYSGSESKGLSFSDFCWMVFGDYDTAVYSGSAKKVDKQVRKQLLELLNYQIQAQLDIQTLKRQVAADTPDLRTAFKTITNNNKRLTTGCLTDFLSVHGMSIGEDAIKIVIRLKGELDQGQFCKGFQDAVKTKQADLKVFHSNIKKTGLRDSNVSFGTPNKRTFFTAQSSAKKHNLALSEVRVRDFVIHPAFETSLAQSRRSVAAAPEPPLGITILKKVAEEERQFERMKQSLLLDPDLDLELVYDTMQDQLTPILIKLYGDASFTSFLRLMLPMTPQHPYLGFIRYNIDNKLSENTLSKVRNLLKQMEEKETRIREVWEGQLKQKGVSKEELFKSLSIDAARITKDQVDKLLSTKQAKLVMHRMDPLKSGNITLQYFN